MHVDHLQASLNFSPMWFERIKKFVEAGAGHSHSYVFELGPQHVLEMYANSSQDSQGSLYITEHRSSSRPVKYTVKISPKGIIRLLMCNSPLPSTEWHAYVHALLTRIYQDMIHQYPLLSPNANGEDLQRFVLEQYSWMLAHPEVAARVSTNNVLSEFIIDISTSGHSFGIYNYTPEEFYMAWSWLLPSPEHSNTESERAVCIAKVYPDTRAVQWLYQIGSRDAEAIGLDQLQEHPNACLTAGLAQFWLKQTDTQETLRAPTLLRHALYAPSKPVETITHQGIQFELRSYPELVDTLESLRRFSGKPAYQRAQFFAPTYIDDEDNAFFLYTEQAVVVDNLVLDPFLTLENGEEDITILGYVFANTLHVTQYLCGYELDSSPPLICLGDANWHHAFLCGAPHYVGGDLQVSVLDGFYNHGALLVKGQVSAGVIIEDDFSFTFGGVRHITAMLGRFTVHDLSPDGGPHYSYSTHDLRQVLLASMIAETEDGTWEIDHEEGDLIERLENGLPILSEAALAHYREHTIPWMLAQLAHFARQPQALHWQQEHEWGSEYWFVWRDTDNTVFAGKCRGLLMRHTGEVTTLSLGCTPQGHYQLRRSVEFGDDPPREFQRDVAPDAPMDYLTLSVFHAAWQALQRFSVECPEAFSAPEPLFVAN